MRITDMTEKQVSALAGNLQTVADMSGTRKHNQKSDRTLKLEEKTNAHTHAHKVTFFLSITSNITSSRSLHCL